MNKFSQWIITICVIIMTVFSVLAYSRVNTIVKMDYTDGYSTRSVLDNLDLNVIKILDQVKDINLYSQSTNTNIKHYLKD